MKRLWWPVLGMLILAGCSGENEVLNRGMELRSALLSAEKCSFRTEITADYGDEIYEFSLDCAADRQGNVVFRVLQPESIADISGTVSETGGQLVFDDTALAFPLMTDDQLTPVMAPWILVKALRGGYITSACAEEDLFHLTLNDSYEENALQVDVWLKEEKIVRCEILHDGRRILSQQIREFELL